jgi:NAD(P)-dependent dehydrogenase (short-subunit alcohol dehydrogenase family)
MYICSLLLSSITYTNII